MGDLIAVTEGINGHGMEMVIPKDGKDEKKAVRTVWNDDFRQDGMGMVAGRTDEAGDAKTMADWLSGFKRNQIAQIRPEKGPVRMLCMAARTFEIQRRELREGKVLHGGIKHGRCRL